MERRAIDVRGLVQGVGFRPFVYNLAVRLGLAGFVRNQTGGVLIEVEGEPAILDRFLAELTDRPPPLARIEHLSWERRPPRGECDFRIEPSEADGSSPVFISPDVATCPDCLARAVRPGRPALRLSVPQLHQLRPAADDHHRVRPTTGRGRRWPAFAMCPACRAEYDDPREPPVPRPADRLPGVRPAAPAARRGRSTDRDARPARRLRRGTPRREDRRPEGARAAITWPATHGMQPPWRSCGGASTATRSRSRSWSPDVGGRGRLCEVCEHAPSAEARCVRPQRPDRPCFRRTRLGSRGRRRRASRRAIPWLGVMLPYTPLHHLLLRAVGGVPARDDQRQPLRRADRLPRGRGREAGGHRRPVPDPRPADPRPLRRLGDARRRRRRAAGPALARLRPAAAVAAVRVPAADPGRRRAAQGDVRPRPRPAGVPQPPPGRPRPLRRLPGVRAGRRSCTSSFSPIRAGVLGPRPAPRLRHRRDTRTERARASGPRLARRPASSCRTWRAAWPSTASPSRSSASPSTAPGYGTDGAVWGGEFLVGRLPRFRRAAHLRYVGMPGGEQAIREPWRMAAGPPRRCRVVAALSGSGVSPTN